MTPQEAIRFLQETIVGCKFTRDKQLKEVCEMSISALEKQIPKRAIMKGFRPCEEICSVSYLCPICKKHINVDKYCYHCGQALDWSGSE